MSYVQWTTSDDTKYYPAGRVVKQLPPGYYAIKEGMGGIFFQRKPIKTERLLRFPDAGSDSVIEEIENFWNLEDRFRKSDVPYKRGIIMYGPPGSGKTCAMRIVVDNLIKNREGIVVDFPGTYLFKESYETLRQIHEGMPLIILMEDLDAILNRNESEVLNLLDGMYGIDKTVFLATTNYPEKLGSRIMNRPSRFDKKIFIGMPSSEAREIFIRSKLIEESDDEVSKWVEDTDGFSIAHIKELYVANTILGDPYDTALVTLRKMKSQDISSSFDDYKLNESWEKYGTGEVYKEAKKKFGQMLAESNVMPSIDDIASLISEDLY